MQNKYLIYLLLFLLVFIQCKTAAIVGKSNTDRNTVTRTTAKEIESKDKIEQGRTFEVFFILKDSEDCISVNISSQQYDDNQNKNTDLNTFFLIEKTVDISKFNSGNNIIYSELGRNFDYNWSVKKEIAICSSPGDPIKRLYKGDKFRIRFTAFKKTNFIYNINIRARQPVEISEKKQ